MQSKVTHHFDMEIHGTLRRPVALVIGTWDPFLPNHEELLHRLKEYADANDVDSAVVMLDPPPAKFLPGKWRWPYFDDTSVRVARLLQCGVSAVIHAQFRSEHLLLGAAEIFDALLSATPIAEAWIGAHQSLGRGSGGDFERIAALGQEHGFRVTRLRASDTPNDHSYQARTFLSEGMIQSAHAVVGHAPTFSRPAGKTPVLVAWPAGEYQVVPLSKIDAPLHGTPIPVTLREVEPGFSNFDWICPESPYLAFIAGPNGVRP